ncbi:hypothetical protein D3C73_677240 [compost metagenome]
MGLPIQKVWICRSKMADHLTVVFKIVLHQLQVFEVDGVNHQFKIHLWIFRFHIGRGIQL